MISDERDVEALRSDGTQLCTMKSLPDWRGYHTMDGDLICGGTGSKTSCLHLGVGGWSKYSWNLLQNRSSHSSWRRPNGGGVQLFGGGGVNRNGKTSEIVTSAGSQKGFDLKHITS